MKSFRCSDDGYSEVIQADDLEQALARAFENWQGGSWDKYCVISVRVAELDEDGKETGEYDWVNVPCGEHPAPPETECGVFEDNHDWVSPHEVVGGLDSNPGVWSLGGTRMVFLTVCECCGLYRKETSVGAQHNPGECDKVEYLPADEKSLEYVGQINS